MDKNNYVFKRAKRIKQLNRNNMSVFIAEKILSIENAFEEYDTFKDMFTLGGELTSYVNALRKKALKLCEKYTEKIDRDDLTRSYDDALCMGTDDWCLFSAYAGTVQRIIYDYVEQYCRAKAGDDIASLTELLNSCKQDLEYTTDDVSSPVIHTLHDGISAADSAISILNTFGESSHYKIKLYALHKAACDILSEISIYTYMIKIDKNYTPSLQKIINIVIRIKALTK